MTIASSGFFFHSCQVERCILTRTGYVSLQDDKLVSRDTHEDYQIRPHGTPLFTDREKRTGVCDSCFSGWTHSDNAPTPHGEAQIAATKKAQVPA